MKKQDAVRIFRTGSGMVVCFILAAVGGVLIGFAASPFSSPSASYQFPTNEVPLKLPELSKDVYPCSQCHDAKDKGNTEQRPLKDMHEEISKLYESGATRHAWCFACHDATNRDKLRMTDGALIPFDEAFRVCGQCHGDQFRRWKNGLHGKHSGSWNGQKTVYLCGHCHSAHLPKFKAMKPLAPPERPDGKNNPGAEHPKAVEPVPGNGKKDRPHE